MAIPVPGQNRGELRRSIGRSLGIMQTGAATSETDSSSLIDTLYLRGAFRQCCSSSVIVISAS